MLVPVAILRRSIPEVIWGTLCVISVAPSAFGALMHDVILRETQRCLTENGRPPALVIRGFPKVFKGNLYS